MQFLIDTVRSWFTSEPLTLPKLEQSDKAFLNKTVSFYRGLPDADKQKFEQRCQEFLYNTDIIGHQLEATQEDKLLVASGSVILAWGFARWSYVAVDTVYLVPRSFNESSEFGKQDSNITGLVGTHHLSGKMILCQPALHQGFNTDNDKRNVAIHEFAHLIDMADGDIDGLPRQLADQAYALPWLALVQSKIDSINQGHSDIRDYGATNNAEFFSVATEYFFERPKLLKRRHPELYRALESFYKQNRADAKTSARIRKKAPCPCGSGKRYKRCCMAN